MNASAEVAVGELVVAGGDGTVDLEVAEHALDAVALLAERPNMFDLHATDWRARNYGLVFPLCKVGTGCVGIVALIGEQSVRCLLVLVVHGVRGFAVSRFADRQMEGEWSYEGIGQTSKFTGDPTPPAARRASMRPFFPPAGDTLVRTMALSMLQWPPPAMISASITATVSQNPASLYRRNRR